MSHPVPGHDYSDKTYPSDSPHKDVVGSYPRKSKNGAKNRALEHKKFGSKGNNPKSNKKYWRGQLADELGK